MLMNSTAVHDGQSNINREMQSTVMHTFPN